MIIIWICVSIILFSIIVLLHEYGHYKTARIFRIKVDEFWLGIPPRAKKLWTNKTGTLFSLNWIPLGWFVKIAGESEPYLKYFNSQWQELPLVVLKNLLRDETDIFDSYGKKISSPERKYISAHIKNQSTGNNFYEKNIFQKTLVLLAGVIINFLLAGVIFTWLFWHGIQPAGINTILPSSYESQIIPTLNDAIERNIILKWSGVLLYPVKDSLAQQAWIRERDILQTLNGSAIWDVEELQKIIWENANTQITLGVFSPCNDTQNCVDTWNRNIVITPNWEWKIWSYLAPNYQVNKDYTIQYPFVKSLKYGFYEVYAQSRITLSGIKMLVKNIFTPETPKDREQALKQVSGPIGIVGVITQSLSAGFLFLLVIGAIISVNLWVFNLLPIPALDGGRILLLWIRSLSDSLFGKSELSQNIENHVHVIFFLLLIALSIIISYNDIIQLISWR